MRIAAPLGHGRPAAAAAWADAGLGLGGLGGRVTQGQGGLAAVELRGDAALWRSQGGGRVHVRREGVRVDLPSRVALLIAPDGFLHLRDPGAEGAEPSPVGPFRGGLELYLADGSIVRVRFAGSAQRGVEQVGVRVAAKGDVVPGRRSEAQQLLWHRGKPARRQLKVRPFQGARLVVLGRGQDIYRAAAMGPALFLQRLALTQGRVASEGPDAREAGYSRPGDPPAGQEHGAAPPPEAALVLWGPALQGSLVAMASRFARHNPEYPGLDKLSAGLASAARVILPAGLDLPLVLPVPTRVAAGSGCRLELELAGSGGLKAPFSVRLLPPHEDHPLVEWHAESTGCDLQILRPLNPAEPNRRDSLRYFQKGLTVPQAQPWPLAARDVPTDRAFARSVLAHIRGR